jgi:myosin heavy subunit
MAKTDFSEDLLEMDENEQETETEKKKSSVLPFIIIGALLLISIIGNTWLFSRNKKLMKEISITKTEMIKIQSDKAQLEDQITSLAGKNRELDNTLEVAQQNIVDKDILIKQLNKENEALVQIKKEISTITEITNKLSNQEKQIKESKAKLKAVQTKINSTINKRQEDNKKMTKELSKKN